MPMTGVAFVTGVSRGLGEALAARLLGAGWSVTGIGRSASARLAHPRFTWLAADLADVVASTRAVQAAMRAAALPAPARALLINNAAVAEPVARLGQLADAGLCASLAVNLVAPVALANAFCGAFDDARIERRIIHVSSGLAARAIAGASLYSIAKCAMEMLTRALTADHPEPSFCAITLRPGIIDTDMQMTIRSQPPASLPDVGMFKDFHESGKLVSAAEVAEAVHATLVARGVTPGATFNYAELLASTQAISSGAETKASASASSARDP